MKKSLVLSMIVISILTFVVSIAAAPQTDCRHVTLQSVSYSSKSLVLKFDVTGFDRRSDIRGHVTVDKTSFPLNCKFDNVKTVKCIVPHMNRYDGLNARIWFSGFVFYNQLPFILDK
jgi:hypothetical protein